jgi:hypothetical protein
MIDCVFNDKYKQNNVIGNELVKSDGLKREEIIIQYSE